MKYNCNHRFRINATLLDLEKILKIDHRTMHTDGSIEDQIKFMEYVFLGFRHPEFK